MNKIKLFSLLVGAFFLAVSCESQLPEDGIYAGPELVKFITPSLTLFAEFAQDTVQIPVSVTTKSNKDRTFTFAVKDTSINTAVSGTHYTVPSTTFTIPANEVVGNVELVLTLANLTNPQTLVIEITDEKAAGFNNIAILTLSRFCAFNRDELLGTYTATYPWWNGDTTYDVEVVAGPQPNQVIIQDFLAGETVDVVVTLDDSDRNNFVASFPVTPNAWTHSAGQVSIDGVGVFSQCDKTMSFQVFHQIPGVGNFGARQTMSMVKK